MENHQKTEGKMTLGQWLLRVLHGALVGVGAIMPGVSGGVLCVLFGIYQPMMALFSHPFKALKKYYKLFIPVLIGCCRKSHIFRCGKRSHGFLGKTLHQRNG